MQHPIAQHHHPQVRELYAYWDAKRRGRRMAARADIDPGEIAKLLPHLLLIDVEREPLRFRCRLAGTAAHDLREGRTIRELTGRYLDEIDFATPEMQAKKLIPPRVVATREPELAAARYTYHGTKTDNFWSLFLPLSNDDAEVHMILVGHFLGE
jgi:hypothetical protein